MSTMKGKQVTYEQLERYTSWSKIYLGYVHKNKEVIVDIINKCLDAGEIIPEYKNSGVVPDVYFQTIKGLEGDALEKIHIKKYGLITPHIAPTFEIGTILHKVWGYDETHNDYFCIVEMTQKSVKLLPLERVVTPSEKAPMSGTAVPGKNILFREKIIMKRRQIKHNGTEYLSMGTHRVAVLWDGKSQYESWYA